MKNKRSKGSQNALKAAKAWEEQARQSKNALQNASDRLREKIGAEKAALQTAADALRKMGMDTKSLDAEIARLNSELGKSKNELDRLADCKNSLNGLADQFTVINTASRAVLPTLNKVNEFFAHSLELAGDLQFQMSSVEAVSGASASDMERLTAVAKEMGATTRYTAMDAANALQQMALAGWEAEGMIAALPGVVNLAASANEELSDMTRILVDGMNAFGMSGTENARKFANVLAKSATSSSTNVSQLGRALEACQGAAGNLGYAIEDVGTVLAGMANNGIKASVAGTALNTLLTRLSGGVEKAEQLMNSMGVSMYYASDGFGHAAGEAKPLLEFINELREGFKQFGDNAKEAQTAAYQLAGMRGMKGLLSIVNMSNAAWEKLCRDVSEYGGAAEEIAGISMDNYWGQLYLLSSAWDALQTSVGEKFIPTATQALRVMTDIATGADSFVQEQGSLVRFIAGFTVTAGGLLSVLTAVAGAIQLVNVAFTTLGVGALMGVIGGFGGVVAIAAAAGLAFAALTAEQERELEVSRKLVKQNQTLSQSYEDACAKIDGNRGSVKNLVAELDELSQKEQKSALDKQRLQQICEELNASLPDLALSYDKESDSIKGLTENLDDYVKSLYDAQQMEADVSQMSKLYGSIRDTSEQLEVAKEKLAQWQDVNSRLAEGGAKTMFGIDSAQAAESAAMVARYTAVIYDLENQLKDAEDAYKALLDKYGETPERVSEAAKGASDLRNTFTRLQNQLQGLQEAYDKAYESAAENVSKQYKLWDEVGKVETKSITEVTKNVRQQLESWKQYQKDLEYLGSLSPDIPGLSEALKMISDGTDESRAYAREMAAEAEKGNGKVYELAQNVGELSQIHSSVTESMAKAATGFDERMANLVTTVKESVEGMDQSGAAETSAKNTLESFIGTIESYQGRVGDAAGAISDIVVNKLSQINANLRLMEAASVRAASIAKQSSNGYLPTAALRGQFASGTLSAPSGMALVGEQGPELVLMRGGETVLTAAETRRLRLEAELLRKAMPDSVRMTENDSRAEFAFLRRNAETVRSLERYVQERAPVPVPGYASGTLNAASGAAVVGERGPELMIMRGGEQIIPATETARILQGARRREESLAANRTEAVFRMEEANRVIQSVSEKTARMEYEVSRTIRIIQESAGDRTTVQETIRALQAFRETERTFRASDSVAHIIRAAEQRERNVRTESDLSRIVRIIRETSGSRTEAETAERIFRTAERNASILREAEQSRTTDSVSSIIRAAEQRERDIRTESEISRIVRIVRETSGSRTEAEAAERIFRQREETERILRRTEAIQPQRERGGFGLESGGGYLEIANPPRFGGGGRESGDTITINLSPVYHIEAGVDPDALMPVFRQNNRELQELIIRTMKDYEYNKRRRAFV